MAKKRTETLNPTLEMLTIAAILVVCLAIGTAFYHAVEGWSYVDSIYFTAVTLTTVGYGDFTPQTDAGKLFTVVYAFVGIGVFLGFAAVMFSAVLDRIRKR